jgi:hypothetical protein
VSERQLSCDRATPLASRMPRRYPRAAIATASPGLVCAFGPHGWATSVWQMRGR